MAKLLATIIAIYVRVSTLDQARHGYSIEDQLSYCRQRLISEGHDEYNIVEYIEPGNSGEWLDRPTLQRLRDDVVNGLVSIIIMYDPDRMSRDLPNQLLLDREWQQLGVKTMFVTGDYDCSPEGRLFFQIKGAVSSYELGKIRERTMRGKRRKAINGKIIQDFGLYGYDFDFENSTYVINNDQADVIREMYRLVIEEQQSVQGVQRELKARCIPSPTGKAIWPVSTIYNILTNITYTGIFVSMRKRYQKTGQKTKKITQRPEEEHIKIPVPAIIDELTFQKAQRQLRQNKAITKQPFKYDFLFSGVLFCGACGRRMLAHHSVFRDGSYKPYYICAAQRYSNLRTAGIKCSSRALPAETFDKECWDLIIDVIADPAKIKKRLSKTSKKKDNSKEIDRLNKLEADLIKRRETLTRWFRQKMIAENEADAELKEIQIQLTDIQERKKVLKPAPQVVIKEDTEAIFERLKALLESGNLPIDKKRMIVRTLLSKVVAARTDKSGGSRQIPKFDISWELK